MPISVRLDPALEARLDQEVRRLGVTKSEFVKDALERVLGLKSPASLLQQVRRGAPMGDSDVLENVSAKVTAKLRARRSD
ncbi:ribbon-helix-helix protein, CopG family [Methylocaldum sp. 14B]|uniref:ribbon-helix-helix protein, CopG family n=1 Tax=Methylocaldum sp. 14B TaxID=1912213 RepID=UPI00098BAF4E|nr:ribbon-helix-helix protein, CopG family [Methylocaldum sp. 14B]